MMQVGYGRTSTLEQVAGLEAQIRDLQAAGVEKIFSEQLSSVDAERPQLEAALDFAREGDVLVITKIDRIARSVAHLCEIEARLQAKGASLKVLTPQLDTSTPIGRLVFNMVGAIAQFEREIMLERQREGIAKAKAEGKYKGRAPTAMAKADEALTMLKGGMGATEVARQLGIGRASVYRIIGAAGPRAAKPTLERHRQNRI
jgi:DNA invertase Pin-like site-specific DNA recombinase